MHIWANLKNKIETQIRCTFKFEINLEKKNCPYKR